MENLLLDTSFNPNLEVEPYREYKIDPRLFDYSQNLFSQSFAEHVRKFAENQPSREDRENLFRNGEKPDDNSWTPTNTALEGLGLALLFKDWAQTRQIRNHPELHETNPLLGKNPSKAKVNTYFALAGLGHLLGATQLPRGPREALQAGTIAIEYPMTRHNDRMGLSVNFPF